MSFTRISLLASSAFVLLAVAACSTVAPQKTPTAGTPTAPSTLPSTTPPGKRPENLKPATFAALPGWDQDDLREAWPAFMTSCEVLLKKTDWREPCAVARDVNAADERAVRTFFEAFFTPYQLLNPDGTDSGLVT